MEFIWDAHRHQGAAAGLLGEIHRPAGRLDRDHQGSQPDVAFADPARQDRRVESDAVISHLQDGRTRPAVQPDLNTRGARVLVRVRQ